MRPAEVPVVLAPRGRDSMTTATEIESLEEEGLVVVDCYANWCGPCQALKPIMARLERDFPAVRFFALDVDKSENIDFQKKHNIRGVPTLLFFKQGELVHQMVGLKSAGEIAGAIKAHA